MRKLKVSIVLWAFVISLGVCGCAQTPSPPPSIRKNNFKTEIPFEVDQRGMLIDTYWGKDSIRHKLLWDNNSPTWVNADVIKNNKSIVKSNEYGYRTTTANGEIVSGDVYVCDQVTLGGITYDNVTMYLFSTKKRGSIGEDIIRTGVWRIDSRNKILTFASSFDSIEVNQKTEILPSSFSDTGITILVNFGKSFRKSIQLDFGYNGGILLPPNEFAKATHGSKISFADSLRFSTPGSSVPTKVMHTIDTFFIGKKQYSTLIETNERVQVNLIGYGFFSQFRYVILDYPRKRVYVVKW